MQKLRLASKRHLTPSIQELLFEACGARKLAGVTAGAHVTFATPKGVRAYSVVVLGEQDSFDTPKTYRFAVRREDEGDGGSLFMHGLQVGDELAFEAVKNDFPVDPENPAVLIAGGIGITPLVSMATALKAAGRPFRLHYAARSAGEAAYAQELADLFGDLLVLHFDDDEATRLSIPDLAASFSGEEHAYICGPRAMIDAMRSAIEAAGVDPARIHTELFKNTASTNGDTAFEVVVNSTGETYTIPADRTILEVLNEAGLDLVFDCQRGDCGICQVDVLEGVPDHRDVVLSDAEKATGDVMQICVSRAKTRRLVLDI